MLEITSDHFTLPNLARLASNVSPSNVKYTVRKEDGFDGNPWQHQAAVPGVDNDSRRTVFKAGIEQINSAEKVDTFPAVFLCLLVVSHFVAIWPHQQPRCPQWCPAHLLTYCFQRYRRVALDDQFVVNVRDDSGASQCLHVVAQDIPADRIGMVNDMYAKSRNDDYKFATVTTQSDYDAF